MVLEIMEKAVDTGLAIAYEVGIFVANKVLKAVNVAHACVSGALKEYIAETERELKLRKEKR